jgi:hypothetical protein
MVNADWGIAHKLKPAKTGVVEGEEIDRNGQVVPHSGRLLATYMRGTNQCELRAVVGNSSTYVTLKVNLGSHVGCEATVMTLLCAYMRVCEADLHGMMHHTDHDSQNLSQLIEFLMGRRGRYWIIATFKWRNPG